MASNPGCKLTFVDRINALKKMRETIVNTSNSIIQEDVSAEDKAKTKLFAANVTDDQVCLAL